MHPRYFIGITLPDYLTEKIKKPQKELIDSSEILKPLEPHITLLHPNILMTLAPLYMIPKVKQVATISLPINVELARTAMFDSRILYIAVKSPELLALHKKLVELLPEDIRARYEIGRDYVPHVTLVQSKPLLELDNDLIINFKKEIDPLLPTTLKVQELTLFTGQDTRKYKIAKI